MDFRASQSRSGAARPARTSAATWLGEVDLPSSADRKPRQLSGGQAQRVAIARALAAEPEVLLLDEPLTGLDVAVAASVRAVLRRRGHSRGGRAAVLITHDLLDVLTLADRVLVLESGAVAEIGPVGRRAGRAPQHVRRPHRGGQPGQRDVGAGARHTCGPPTARWARHRRPGPERRAAMRSRCSPRPLWRSIRDPPHGSPRNSVAVTRGGAGHPRRRRSGCAARSNPTVHPAWPPASPPMRRRNCGWPPGSEVWFSVKAQEVALARRRRARLWIRW